MLHWQRALRRSAGLLAVMAVGLMAVAAAPVLAAESKSERATGKLVSYDAAAQAIVVKEGGKDSTYQVKAEGSVLTRTTLTMNGKVAKYDDLKPGMIVIVYWKPDAADATKRLARKIDVPKIPRELLDEMEAEEKKADAE
jgi:type IV pilus biogenesis protein CpaD/CtpE